MNIKTTSDNKVNLLKLAIQTNCYASILLLLTVSLVSLSGEYDFFHNLSDLYGPLAGNLKLMLFYLCLTEVTVFSYCIASKNYQGIAVMGVFMMLLVPSLHFYGYVNQIPIDPQYNWFFLYIGGSHVGFGIWHFLNKDQNHE
jgi:hypothetical protein